MSFKSKTNILFSLLILFLAFETIAAKELKPVSASVSLAGDWLFKLDPKSEGRSAELFKTKLTDSIQLPGSCEQYGYGMKTTVPEVLRLTRKIKYVGQAWYQKEIDIPTTWKAKRVELFLERCHWESNVWVDDQPFGMQNSLSTPHLYDLGILKPGKHTLTICIDNTYKLPIGTWGHSITEDTQTNWNGIIGRIEMRATDLVWIKNVQVYPDSMKVVVGNTTGKGVNITLQSHKFNIPTGGKTVELAFNGKVKLWDEFAPEIQSVTLTLKSGMGNDSKTVVYGTRKLSIKNRQFLLNDRPMYLRGSVDECVYPLTGYAPMDKASWLRVIRINQSYGFNCLRFHTWCPPEAGFEAADELGFMFQVELPLWTMGAPAYGKHPARDLFIEEELNNILETYGNHPSFALMAMGNESHGNLNELTIKGRKKDSRHLYRCETGSTEENGHYYETGQRGIVGPKTNWDRTSLVPGWIEGGKNLNNTNNVTVPIFSHEVGQWCMYPDLDDAKKYTGNLYPYYFDKYKKLLEAHHLLDQAKDFFTSSGILSVLLYKDEIEGSLRTFPYGGFQILDARDYTGQGTAIVGWLDAFWDSKGLITPEEFRQFCAPTVCLMRMPKRVYTANESFQAEAEIAHYGPNDIEISPEWKITNAKGELISNGTLASQKIKTGCNTKLGAINAALTKIKSPEKLLVSLSAVGTSNSWEIWVYPELQPKVPQNVKVLTTFDATTKTALANGERVLLFSSPAEGIVNYRPGMLLKDSVRYLPTAKPGKNAIEGTFMPVFWCIGLFNQIGTMGILCDPTHPAFASFPTEAYTNWQWADLLGNFSGANSFKNAGAMKDVYENMRLVANDKSFRSKAIFLDSTPADFRPILQVIDNYDRNSKLGTIFEARVGKGKLLVCAMDLQTDAASRPAARQLMQSLLEYVAGDKFSPKDELPVELLDNILK